ncbi:MAG: hypothetical protein ACI4LO_04270 [Anaerovoracaceae bacterium]
MNLKKQIICCMIIGFVAFCCENCGSMQVHESYEKLKETVFKEYSFCEFKKNCIVLLNSAEKIPEKVKNADEYLNEIMAAE